MYTAGCYLLFSIPTFLSLKYISGKFTSWTGLANIDKAGKSVIQLIKSIVGLFNLILIFFFVIVACSAYLYFNCQISQNLSNHINETMKLELNKSTDITIKHTFMGAPTGISQALGVGVIMLFLTLYPYLALIKPILCEGYIKANILLFSEIFVCPEGAVVNFFILSVVKIPSIYGVVTLVDVFDGYNKCYKLVFYSTILLIISNAIVYVVNYYNKNRIVIVNFLENQEKEKAVSSHNYLFINILMVFTKLCSYVALFGMFHGILFLKGYCIPCSLDSYLSLNL